jgi:hypothetical protein
VTIAFEVSGLMTDGDNLTVLQNQIVTSQPLAAFRWYSVLGLQHRNSFAIEINQFAPLMIRRTSDAQQQLYQLGSNTALLHPARGVMAVRTIQLPVHGMLLWRSFRWTHYM